MYCVNCGTIIDSKLSFCQSCGSRIVKASAENRNLAGLKDLTIVTGFFGIAGLGITLGLIAVLLNFSVKSEVIVILALAFLCAVFGITFWMTRQTARMFNDSQLAPENYPEPAQIKQPNAAQLSDWREPARSVVENTTRTLDKTEI